MAKTRVFFTPKAGSEKSAAELHRDTRPWYTRLAEAAGDPRVAAVFLGAGAAAAYGLPATVDAVLPLGLCYGGWITTRRPRMPLCLPMSSGLRDPGDRDTDTNRPKPAQGVDYIGVEIGSGLQAWHGLEYMGQHTVVPGTTGSGKTRVLKAVGLLNALAQGSGVLYVDGKGDNKLVAQFMEECRRYGREDDFILLNFLTAHGGDSWRLNPYFKARGNMIREILVGQMNEPGSEGNGGVFFDRAVAFLGIIAPILEWLRTAHGVPTTLERVRDLTEHANVIRMATKRQVKFTDSAAGREWTLDVPDMPHEYVQALKDYLGQTGGYDLDVPLRDQRSSQPADQHSFVTMQFTGVFTQWLVTLGHIFRVEQGDIDMLDVMLNRRVMLVVLPVLEGSEKTTAALGKIVVAMLKAVMALSLGSKVEGDMEDVVGNRPSASFTPFKVCFDELVYYVTNGMDASLAMGRELGLQFLLGFQEASGILARIGEKLWSLLGNASLMIVLKLQDGNLTRSYIEKTAGTVHVTQSTSYNATSAFTAGHTPSDQANVQEVQRFNWLDAMRHRPGEATVVFGDRLAQVKTFDSPPRLKGTLRRNRPDPLPPPDLQALRRHSGAVEATRDALAGGLGSRTDNDLDVPGPLAALLRDFGAALRDSPDDPTAAAVLAVSRFAWPGRFAQPTGAVDPAAVPQGHQEAPPPEGGGESPPPGEQEHVFSAALRASASAPHGSPPAPEAPMTRRVAEGDQGVLASLARIERAGGRTLPEARAAARRVLAARDEARKDATPSPMPKVAPDRLGPLIDGLIEGLMKAGPRQDRRQETFPFP